MLNLAKQGPQLPNKVLRPLSVRLGMVTNQDQVSKTGGCATMHPDGYDPEVSLLPPLYLTPV